MVGRLRWFDGVRACSSLRDEKGGKWNLGVGRDGVGKSGGSGSRSGNGLQAWSMQHGWMHVQGVFRAIRGATRVQLRSPRKKGLEEQTAASWVVSCRGVRSSCGRVVLLFQWTNSELVASVKSTSKMYGEMFPIMTITAATPRYLKIVFCDFSQECSLKHT